jgi:hypothetical protein
MNQIGSDGLTRILVLCQLLQREVSSLQTAMQFNAKEEKVIREACNKLSALEDTVSTKLGD